MFFVGCVSFRGGDSFFLREGVELLLLHENSKIKYVYICGFRRAIGTVSEQAIKIVNIKETVMVE